MERNGIEALIVGLFACPNFLGIGTPLIFSRRGDGGEVFKGKSFNNESTPKTLKKRKPRRHGGHRDTQSIVNQHYKLCELSEAVSRTP